VLAGKVATVLPFFEESFEGLAGGGSARDLETLLQLVYLRFTKPRADATAFGVMLEQVKSLAANRRSNPETLFEDTVSAVVWQNHFRKRPLSAELIQEMSLEKSFAFYKDRFADASDFVFVFAGSFDVATMRPLVTRYLASLPSAGRKETWRDTGITPVRGVVEKVVEKGLEPRAGFASSSRGRSPGIPRSASCSTCWARSSRGSSAPCCARTSPGPTGCG